MSGGGPGAGQVAEGAEVEGVHVTPVAVGVDNSDPSSGGRRVRIVVSEGRKHEVPPPPPPPPGGQSYCTSPHPTSSNRRAGYLIQTDAQRLVQCMTVSPVSCARGVSSGPGMCLSRGEQQRGNHGCHAPPPGA